MIRRHTILVSMMSAAALLAGCAGAHIPPPPVVAISDATTRDSSAVQLGTALATVEQDSAADQSVLDSLHERSVDAPGTPRTNQPLAGEDVRQEAEQLF